MGEDIKKRAEELAAAHRSLEDQETVAVYWKPAADEVRLLEVLADVPSSSELFQVRFGRTKNFPVPSAIILVSVDELAALQNGKLKLPDSWGVFDDLLELKAS